MTVFPDAYKKQLLQHSRGIVEVARVLHLQEDISLDAAIYVTANAHLDATVALVFNSINLKPVKK